MHLGNVLSIGETNPNRKPSEPEPEMTQAITGRILYAIEVFGFNILIFSYLYSSLIGK